MPSKHRSGSLIMIWSLMGCNIPQDSFCNMVNSKEETTSQSQCTYVTTSIPPSTMPTPSPNTPTPPPNTPIPPRITPTLQPKSCSAMKKKRVGSTGLQAEPLRTLQFRDRKRDSHSTVEANDDISAFGSYVSAQLRQFGRRLQTKAKLEINKLLYNIELEHLESTNSSSIERSQCSNLSNYLEFEDSIESSTNHSMPDDQYELTANTSALPGLQQPIIYITNDGTILTSTPAQTGCNTSTANNSVVILDDAVLSPPTTQAALSPEAKETQNAIERLLK